MSFPHRAVFEAARSALHTGEAGALALVLETEGSTYVRAGAAAWFGAASSAGWLSGGCLEPEIARHAASAVVEGRVVWLELDTRDDEDLLAGSTAGCRGRLRLALLPLREMEGFADTLQHWHDASEALLLAIGSDGLVHAQMGETQRDWRVPAQPSPWSDLSRTWELAFPAASRVALFGAGPETALLLPLLRTLGWKTLLVERRARWETAAALADRRIALAPAEALRDADVRDANAALVMHHHFEFDREALEVLAASPVRFVGLLGPRRRRDDLFRLLDASARESLEPRLRSPVGLDLGGQGAEAIALSIAAQLQAFRDGR